MNRNGIFPRWRETAVLDLRRILLAVVIAIAAVALSATSAAARAGDRARFESLVEKASGAEDRGAAIDALARSGPEAVRFLVAELLADRLHPAILRAVLTALPNEQARRHLPELLAHEDPRVVRAAGWAVTLRAPDPALESSLIAALERFALQQGEWPEYAVASALVEAVPGVASARRVLKLARLRQGQPGDELMGIVHGQAPGLLTGEERLDFLLGWAVIELDAGPGIFDVEPGRPETFEPYLGPADLELLRVRRDEVVERLTSDLEDRGSRFAAVLLAWLGERAALPELRRRLFSASDTYGWETSFPTLFAEGNHRGYHAYGRAIELLAGRPLEEAVRPTKAEIEALARRSDGTALLLLHRLAPEVARARIFELFRTARKAGNCLEPGNTIREYDLVPAGTPLTEASEWLGAADTAVGNRRFYCCVDSEWAGDFALVTEGDRVLAFESEYRDGGGSDSWCLDHPATDPRS